MNEDSKYIAPDFEEYIKQGEPDRTQKVYNWQTAIGLQAVDGLRTSEYLIETAKKHIEGDIDINQAQELLRTYYQSKTVRVSDDDVMEEADRVAANITKILSTQTLAFNTNGYVATHRQIFEGIFKFAGKIRDYDITKKEWVLRGDTVSYLNHEDLRMALDYDIQQERDFDYSGLTMGDVAKHIARFVSGLWQIHAFGEGNTRTTAVFTIQYLRSIGFDINNDLFARHSWYFRNALVRANFKSAKQGVMYDFSFLEKFFANLLMGEHYELKNRHLLIDAPEEWGNNRSCTEQVPNKQPTSTGQVPIDNVMDNENIKLLTKAIGKESMSVKEMLEAMGLKHRPTFLDNYLKPAKDAGMVKMLYPNQPKHPRQKYMLTVKGLTFFNEMSRKDSTV
jgi:fido (protein-threonine AMPylation protein)